VDRVPFVALGCSARRGIDHHMDTTPGCNADRYAVERPHRPDILSTSLTQPRTVRGSLYSVDADSVSAARQSSREGLRRLLRERSALRPKGSHVRFTPESGQTARPSECPLCAQKRTYAPQQRRSLFDHLVSARKQRRRHFEAQRLGGLEIHDEFEFRGLFDRELGRFRTLENFVDVIT